MRRDYLHSGRIRISPRRSWWGDFAIGVLTCLGMALALGMLKIAVGGAL